MQSQIVQDCGLLDAGIGALEDQAIQNLLDAHQLPASDRDRIVNWERDAVRAMVFNGVVAIISKPAAERTAAEQTIYDA